jgi:hypothetical protein
MGVTIHFKGKIDEAELIGNFVNEMKAICHEINWEYTLIDNATFNGIVIKPHEKSESLPLFFNDEGKLQNLMNLVFDSMNDEASFMGSIKTQYAPIEVHISIVKLLKYIKSKYISNLEVFDEGSYWETSDKKILKVKLDFIASKIEMVGDILNAHQKELQETSSLENIADKIDEILKRYGFDKN